MKKIIDVLFPIVKLMIIVILIWGYIINIFTESSYLWSLVYIWLATAELVSIGDSLRIDIVSIWRGLPLPSLFPTITNHGDTIAKVVRGIQMESVEYLAIFAESGTKLLEITNHHPSGIFRCKELREIYQKNKRTVTIHNHPGKDDCPFSSTDIFSMMRHQERQGIVVTQKSVYIMTLRREYSLWEAWTARLIMGTGSSRKGQIRACERVARRFRMTFDYCPIDRYGADPWKDLLENMKNQGRAVY